MDTEMILKLANNRINSLIQSIEEKTGTSLFDNEDLKDKYKSWRHNELKSSYFVLSLTKYLNRIAE